MAGALLVAKGKIAITPRTPRDKEELLHFISLMEKSNDVIVNIEDEGGCKVIVEVINIVKSLDKDLERINSAIKSFLGEDIESWGFITQALKSGMKTSKRAVYFPR